MSKYDFILAGITFSYSALSSFNCKYAYKLTYIDALERENNFYGQYGSFVHEIYEKFFMNELEEEDLAEYYKNNFVKAVPLFPPPYPQGLKGRYYVDGYEYFKAFKFDKSKYEVLGIEDTIDFNVADDIMFTARPDLVLKNKETGIVSMIDYKTSKPYKINKKTGKETPDKDKLEGYYKQMHIYSYALRHYKNIPCDEITIWYPRLNKVVSIPILLENEEKAIEWVKETVALIKQEEDFEFNNSSKYFCQHLCGVRKFCEHK